MYKFLILDTHHLDAVYYTSNELRLYGSFSKPNVSRAKNFGKHWSRLLEVLLKKLRTAVCVLLSRN